ncbi:unnamed protein product, partial [Meganyctiphanes norvegica]
MFTTALTETTWCSRDKLMSRTIARKTDTDIKSFINPLWATHMLIKEIAFFSFAIPPRIFNGFYFSIFCPNLMILVTVADMGFCEENKKEIVKIAQKSTEDVKLSLILNLHITHTYQKEFGQKEFGYIFLKRSDANINSSGRSSVMYIYWDDEMFDLTFNCRVTRSGGRLGVVCTPFEGPISMRLANPLSEGVVEKAEIGLTQKPTTFWEEDLRSKNLCNIIVSECTAHGKITHIGRDRLMGVEGASLKTEKIWCHAFVHSISLGLTRLRATRGVAGLFSKLTLQNNTLILPANVADVTGVVGSGVSIYKTLSKVLQNNSVTQPEIPQITEAATTEEDDEFKIQ